MFRCDVRDNDTLSRHLGLPDMYRLSPLLFKDLTDGFGTLMLSGRMSHISALTLPTPLEFYM